MVKRNKNGALTDEEKRVAKSLLTSGMRNQDIQDLINQGRLATINIGRITEVKQDNEQTCATDNEIELFKLKRELYDPITGLNEIDHERLIRSREAMMMAVDIYNSPHLKFKTELFSVLANISWTYLMHEYHEGVLSESIIKKNGDYISLYEMITSSTSPLSGGVINNLKAIKQIRDEVEHKIFGKSDSNWLAIFQSCCVNYENTICDLFGDELSLQRNLNFAIQFSRISLEQISETQELSMPANIVSLDKSLNQDVDNSLFHSPEYRLQVVYTFNQSTKSSSHIRFISPDSEAGHDIQNVLIKKQSSDEEYPFKPMMVVNEVKKKVPNFTSNCHQLAWKRHNARPLSRSKQPERTNKDYCVYHATHKDYTYSQKWIDYLILTYSDHSELKKLKNYI